MAEMTKTERADAILSSTLLRCVPLEHEPGFRLIGWVVPQEVVGLTEGFEAIHEIERRAKAGR